MRQFASRLSLAVFVTIVCSIGSTTPARAQCEVAKLTASDGVVDNRFGWAIAIGGDYAVVGTDHPRTLPGAAYIYERDGLSWTEIGRLVPAVALGRNDEFGRAVAISGRVAVAGARKHGFFGQSNRGAVYVFRRNIQSGHWAFEQQLLATDGAAGDLFGSSVAIDGDWLVVGAPENDEFGDEKSGTAYVFHFDGSVWSQARKFRADDRAAFDQFGNAVTINDNWVAVGSKLDDDACPGLPDSANSGSVYTFFHDPTAAPNVGWQQRTKLQAQIVDGAHISCDAAASDNFGQSVAISGGRLVVGAHFDDDDGSNSGSAYVYRLEETDWVIEQKLTASDGAALDSFGRSVAIHDDLVLVGAWKGDLGNPVIADTGSAYLYRRAGTRWIEELELTASGATGGDRFGQSVSIGGDYAAIGARGNNADTGSAYIFAIGAESDCNENGVHDDCEILAAPALDSNGNDTLDSCECATDAECVATLPCINGTCDQNALLCIFAADPGFCAIRGVCFDNGAPNPDNDCQFCNSVVSDSDWSNRDEGLSCGDPADSTCDHPDACDGEGLCRTNPEPAGTNCAGDGNECTDDQCDGAGACSHPNAADLTPCTDDGIECMGNRCFAGRCLAIFQRDGTPCGDQSNTECDLADTCDGAGNCLDNIRDDGTPCFHDGLFCTGEDSCQDGVCESPGDPCTSDGFVCDGNAELRNECSCDPAVEGICGDGLFCNGVETCNFGVCVSSGDPCGGTGLSCDELTDSCKGPLFLGRQFAADSRPWSIAISDLNGDQVPDLAVANLASDNVSVLLGVGDGTFAAAVNYAAGDRPLSVAIGDLDGDQVPDLAVANNGSDNVSVLLGVGDGTFVAAVPYAVGHRPESVAIGDLDGDRVPDLAVANERSDNISVLVGVGNGTFAVAVHYAAGDGPFSVAIADLDGDQVPDLAVANSDSDDVSVLLGVGDGTFAVKVNYTAGDSPRSVAIGDLNGDQVPDLAVAASGTYPEYDGNVSVLLGLGDGTFSPAVPYAAGERPQSVTIGDLDGDQVPDLAVASESSSTVSVLLGVGDGRFRASVDYATGLGPISLAIGDLDGDQVLDLATANWGADLGPGDVSVLLGVGDGTFPSAAVQFATGDAPTSVAIGDLNGDRVPDLAVAANGTFPEFEGSVSVLMGLGEGRFAAAVNYGVGDRPSFIAIGDLDGDQVPDLAVANTNSNNISVLLGVGDGTFAAAVHYAAGHAPVSVAMGDLDGDEVPDLAVANSGSVAVLLGVGDGTYVAAVLYAAGSLPWSVAISDLNGDQVPDLAVANFASGNVSVLLGVGDGMFAAAVQYAVGSRPSSVAIGDLDGDQVPDLATANVGSWDLSVLLGVGDGTFTNAVHYATGAHPRSVGIGDLNADEVPDLTVANTNGNIVSVLPGVGDGTFAAALHYAAGDRPTSVAIGDLNGDGALDLAVANLGGDSVSVLLNQSSGDCDGNGIADECELDCGQPGSPCDFPGCGQSVDCNDNGVPDECEVDSDGDGFPDDCDACLESDLAKLIVVEECPTGVTNALLDDGCTMNDVLAECSVVAHNHGQWKACVARHANEWRRQGLLSGKDVGRIVHCAGTSNEPRPSKRGKR